MANEIVVAVLIDGQQVEKASVDISSSVAKMAADIKASAAEAADAFESSLNAMALAEGRSADVTVAYADEQVATLERMIAKQRAALDVYNARLASGTLTGNELAATTMAASNAHRMLGDSLASTGSKLDTLATKAQVAGRAMSMYLTAPIALAAGLSAKMAIDFQKNIELIHTQAGAPQAEVARQQKYILDLAHSGNTQYSPNELAQAIYHLESLGLRGPRASSALNVVQTLSGMGGANIEDTASAVGGILVSQIPGIKETNPQQVARIINAIVGQGNMRMEDFNNAISTGVTAAAGKIGMTLPEMGAAIDVLVDRRMGAQMAGTRLKMALSMAEDPTASGAAALAHLGIAPDEMGNLMRTPDGFLKVLELLKAGMDSIGKTKKDQTLATQYFMDAFGKGRSSSGMLTLVQSLGSDTSSYQGKLSGIDANTQKEYTEKVAQYHKTAAYQISAAWASIQASMIKAGDTEMPIIVGLAHALNSLVSGFTALPGPVKDFAGAGLLVLAALGPIVYVTGTVIKSIRGLEAVFRAAGTAAKWMGGQVKDAGGGTTTDYTKQKGFVYGDENVSPTASAAEADSALAQVDEAEATTKAKAEQTNVTLREMGPAAQTGAAEADASLAEVEAANVRLQGVASRYNEELDLAPVTSTQAAESEKSLQGVETVMKTDVPEAATEMEASVAAANEGMVVATDAASLSMKAAMISTGIGAIVVAVSIGVQEIITHWSTVKQWFEDFGAWLESHIKIVFAVAPILGLIVEIVKHWKGIETEVQKLAGDIASFFTGPIHTLENMFSGLKNFVVGIFKDLAGVILAPIEGALKLASHLPSFLGGGAARSALSALEGLTGAGGGSGAIGASAITNPLLAHGALGNTGGGGLSTIPTGSVASTIAAVATKLGFNPQVALAMSAGESSTGQPGDYGRFVTVNGQTQFVPMAPGAPGGEFTSFGPYGLHAVLGSLPSNVWAQGPAYASQWANSPAGIAYAIKKMQATAYSGLTPQAQIATLVKQFERPLASDVPGEIATDLRAYASEPGSVGGTGPVTDANNPMTKYLDKHLQATAGLGGTGIDLTGSLKQVEALIRAKGSDTSLKGKEDYIALAQAAIDRMKAETQTKALITEEAALTKSMNESQKSADTEKLKAAKQAEADVEAKLLGIGTVSLGDMSDQSFREQVKSKLASIMEIVDQWHIKMPATMKDTISKINQVLGEANISTDARTKIGEDLTSIKNDITTQMDNTVASLKQHADNLKTAAAGAFTSIITSATNAFNEQTTTDINLANANLTNQLNKIKASFQTQLSETEYQETHALSNMTVSVSGKGFSPFTFHEVQPNGEPGLTPTEQKIQTMENENSQLQAAQQLIADRNAGDFQAVQQDLYNIELFNLQKKATLERAAANEALKKAKEHQEEENKIRNEHIREREQSEEQAARDRTRKAEDAFRNARKADLDQMKTSLKDLNEGLETKRITTQQYDERVQKLLVTDGLKITQISATTGQGLVHGLQPGIDAAIRLWDKYATAMDDAMRGKKSGYAPIPKLVVPPKSSMDSGASPSSPNGGLGESGNILHLHFHAPVIGTKHDKFIAEVAPQIRSAMLRTQGRNGGSSGFRK